MAQYQNTEDPIRQAEGYGNPLNNRSGNTGGEYGTGGHETATTGAGKYSTGGEYGTGAYETATTGAGMYGAGALGSGTGTGIGGQYEKEQRGKLHRSGSSGSSSSEDDGQGGRRKKGTKKNLTGTGQVDPSLANVTSAGGGYSAEQGDEKKGFMDKIKEKLPGHRGQD